MLRPSYLLGCDCKMVEKVWADAVTITGAGATAGTLDAASQITMRKGAGALIAIQYLIVGAIPTSGENGVPILRLSSDSLGITNQDFVLSSMKTDGIATNDKEAPVYAGIIPLAFVGDFSFADVNLSISSNVNVTGGWEGALGVIYADSVPDDQYARELLSFQHGAVKGGKRTEQDAGISAASETSFANSIEIPAGFTTLCGLAGVVNPNAPANGEATSGYTSFQSSDIPDFGPQRWVFMWGYSGSLGTPIGTPVPASGRSAYWPTRFPLTGQKVSIEVAQKLAVALTNAADGIAAAVYR